MNFHDLLSYNADTGVFHWKVNRGRMAKAGDQAGTLKPNGYVEIQVSGKIYKAHRLAWFMAHDRWPDDCIDHINRRTADNRIVNLRECSRSENLCNSKRHANNTTGFKGVSYQKADKIYVAIIRKNGKRTYLGSFKTAEDAVAVVREARKQLHGEFARHG